MSMRFRRSLRLAPGIRLNVGLRGPSVSVGPRGAGVTLGPAGLTSHVGIPGTGLSYRQTANLSSAGATEVPRAIIPSDARPMGGNLYSVSARLSLGADGRLEISGADGQPLDPRIERAVRAKRENELRVWLREQCNEINAGMDEILSLHRGTPPPRNDHRYTGVAFPSAQPPEPRPLKLGILDRMFVALRRLREARHAEALERYRVDHERWQGARDAHDAAQERLRRRSEEERLTSPTVMHELLAEALHAIRWPRETLVSFDLEDDGRLAQVDVDLPEIEDMPARSAEVASRGFKLNIHERSQAQLRKLYLAHIHGVLFRMIGETFATLPTVETVECSGFSQRVDPATGLSRDDYLLSVRVRRKDWEGTDFAQLEQVDPVASLERFELRRDSSASSILQPITPFAARAGHAPAEAAADTASSAGAPRGGP